MTELISISFNLLQQLAVLPEQMNPSEIFGCKPLFSA